MHKTVIGATDPNDPLAAPEWLVERIAELSRLMSSSDRSVANGVWAELIKRKLVSPNFVPGRVMGPLGWKSPTVSSTGTSSVVQMSESA